MQFDKLRGYLRVALILVLMVLTWGCGSGGGSTPNTIDSNSSTGTVIPLGNGTFVIQLNAVDNVAAMDLHATYDNSSLGSPSVNQGSSITDAGAMFLANTDTPGIIRIVFISIKPIAGNGQIAIVSFASHAGTGNFTATADMIDVNGKSLGSWSSTANDF